MISKYAHVDEEIRMVMPKAVALAADQKQKKI
jgi:hypothetical protein